MSSPLPISLVIPTCNMVDELENFLLSLESSDLAESCEAVIIVNDGSTDHTARMLVDFSRRPKLKHKLRQINLPENRGRFIARKIGCEDSTSEYILFLDTRIEIPEDFVEGLRSLVGEHSVVQGTVEIPVKESVYSLYWDRSHRYIFKQNFEDQKLGFWLTKENYEKYASGTGIFLCKRNIFLQACDKFEAPPISDDRALIREICTLHGRIWVTEKLRVLWRPRQTFLSFLHRIWERGPSFVAYHFYGPSSNMKWGVYAGLVVIFFNLLAIIFFSSFWFISATLQLGLLSTTVLVFTRDPREVTRLLPLHLAVIMTFGFGILWGLIKENPYLVKARAAS